MRGWFFFFYLISQPIVNFYSITDNLFALNPRYRYWIQILIINKVIHYFNCFFVLWAFAWNKLILSYWSCFELYSYEVWGVLIDKAPNVRGRWTCTVCPIVRLVYYELRKLCLDNVEVQSSSRADALKLFLFRNGFGGVWLNQEVGTESRSYVNSAKNWETFRPRNGYNELVNHPEDNFMLDTSWA